MSIGRSTVRSATEVIGDQRSGPQHRQAGAASPRHTLARTGLSRHADLRPCHEHRQAASELSRASSAPPGTVSLKQDRQAGSAPGRAAGSGDRLALATAAIVHGSGPPFTYRHRRAARPRDPGQRQGIPDPQPDEDQQRAAGRGRSGAAGDGQRSGADARAGRSARRPDDDDRQGEPPRGSPREPSGRRGSSARELSSSSRRPPTRPSGGTICTSQIAAAFRPLIRDGILGTRHLARERGIEPHAVDPRQGRATRASAARGPARPRHPRADGQARRAGLPGVLRGVHVAPRSARSSSA